MKDKHYVEQFYEGIFEGNEETANELVDKLFRECNAEVEEYRSKARKDGKQPKGKHVLLIVEKFNRKGNRIADAINTKAGRKILTDDWFRKCVKYVEHEEPKKKDPAEDWE